MEKINVIGKTFLILFFVLIPISGHAQWITIPNCYLQTYTYSVLVGYTGENLSTPVYQIRHRQYQVCNPIQVWAGPLPSNLPVPSPIPQTPQNQASTAPLVEQESIKTCELEVDNLVRDCKNTYETTASAAGVFCAVVTLGIAEKVCDKVWGSAVARAANWCESQGQAKKIQDCK